MMAPARASATERRLKILLVNELANPQWVSVPAVGWRHGQALRKIVDVVEVTSSVNRENYLQTHLREGTDFDSIDISGLDRALIRASKYLGVGEGLGLSTRTAMHRLPYQWFEHLAWRKYGKRLQAGEFDLVHRATPLSPSMPSSLASRCKAIGVPFVVGPINGGLPWPRGFGRVRMQERDYFGIFRDLQRYFPGYRRTWNDASAIVAGSRQVRRELARWRDKVVYIPENGIDPASFQGAPTPADGPLRVIFVGRLVAVKCLDVLLEAAASLLREGRIFLTVVGDGPELAGLEALARRERLDGAVRFAGWSARDVVSQKLAESHLFAFPSIRDFGGGAVLEAMASCVPPIVVDYGGPAELVTESTGFLVPMGPRPTLVAGFRSLLERIVADPSGLAEKGRRARERVCRHFSWDAKAAQMLEVYRWVLGQRERPDFGMPFPDDV